jgi:type IV pilus assembly protein PilX
MPGKQSGTRQRGMALLATLGILLAMMILGVSAMRAAFNGEKSARAERDRYVALQAAEAALLDAERDIEGAAGPGAARTALFAPGAAASFEDGCGAGAGNPALGLCAHALPPAPPAWQRVRLADPEPPDVRFVEFGRFTAAVMPVGRAMLPARLPRYVIEQLPYVRAGEDAGRVQALFFRITAIGFGASSAHCVVLQTYYLKTAPPGAAA